MDKLTTHTSQHSHSLLGYGLMLVSLGLLALSPVVVIWLAADWLNSLFANSDTFFANSPRLYTVFTIVAVAAAITLIADKLYKNVKAHQKRALEHI